MSCPHLIWIGGWTNKLSTRIVPGPDDLLVFGSRIIHGASALHPNVIPSIIFVNEDEITGGNHSSGSFSGDLVGNSNIVGKLFENFMLGQGVVPRSQILARFQS